MGMALTSECLFVCLFNGGVLLRVKEELAGAMRQAAPTQHRRDHRRQRTAQPCVGPRRCPLPPSMKRCLLLHVPACADGGASPERFSGDGDFFYVGEVLREIEHCDGDGAAWPPPVGSAPGVGEEDERRRHEGG